MKVDDSLRPSRHAAEELGHEARAGSDDHAVLRLWLRLLSCTTQLEAEIRRRLRERFGISLARFDYLAQLHRFREGLRMSALSRHLMVTGGNVTGLTDELVREGMVVRENAPDDRRAWIVRLTPAGRRSFDAMAREHERWVLELCAGIDARTVRQLHANLGTLRARLTRNMQSMEESR